MSIQDVIERARHEPPWTPPEQPLPRAFTCKVFEPVSWDRDEIQHAIEVELPEEIVALWNGCGGLRLYDDMTYHQWGMKVFSPLDAVVKNRYYRKHKKHGMLPGDLVFAGFLGDGEFALIRADKSAADYGSIVIAAEIDPRSDWDTAAPTVEGFLKRFMDTHGDKYWEATYGKVLAERQMR